MQNRRDMWRRKIMRLAVAAICFLLLPLVCQATNGVTQSVIATPFSMDFHGFIPSARPGDLVTVEDTDGVVCGVFTVKTAGRYGFVHVYGDDPATPEDEGARPGDRLTFLLNGVTLAGAEVVWKGDGQRQQVDFSGQ